MEKKPGWEIALANTMTEGLKVPHKWGEHDCVTFAADCVQAMTGEDALGDLRGSYDSPISAARVIRQMGCATLGDAVATVLPEILPADARRGDVVLCWSGEHDFLAVVERHMAIGPGPNGTVQIPLVQIKRAFRIGAC
jgi:hypothetical protein